MIGDRLLRVAHHAFIVLVVVGTTAVLTAQTVVDPRFVEFNASPDHNAQASDGTPIVQRYSMSIHVTGSSTPTDTIDLGKPAPVSGIIRVDFLPLLNVALTPGVVFEARVTAIGPGGSTPSTVSNGFSFTPPCAPTLSPTSQAVAFGGGPGSVGVAVAAGCTWSATSNSSWITLTGATGGTGNGSVPYNVAANPNGSPRTGTLTIAGQTFTVNQAAAPCTFSVAPTSQAVIANGGTGATNVTAPTGCTWTAVSNNTSWLTVTAGATGNGNGTVSFSAAANPNGTTRAGTLTIAGQTFTVNQAAAPCTVGLTPASQSVIAAGGTGSTTVTSPTGCTWTAVSNNTSWLTVTAGASGSGNGTVSFSAAANPNGTTRAGTVTIGGQTFTVNQAAAPCTVSLAPTSQSVVAAGGTGSTAVTSPTGCAWTAVSNNTSWLTVTTGATGNGNGSVSFSATANPNGTTRAGTITISGQTFTVNQAAAPCTFSLTPTSQSVVASGGTGSTSVASPTGCTWSAVSNDTGWLSVTAGATGNGNGTVSFNAAANPNASTRAGTITIGGQTFTVNQAAAPCTFSLAPTSQSVVAAGGTGSTAVTSPTGCAWTAVSNNTSWLTVTAGASGSGNGSVSFSAAANPNGTTRAGTVTIGGQTFTVNQAAAPCTVSLTPTSQSVIAGGGTGSTSVTSPTGCAWTAVSNNTSWLTVTAGATGSGPGTVSFSAAANPNGTTRAGTITIGGQTFTVNQAAAPCTFSLAPASQSVVAGGGTASTTVTSPTGCSWTAVSNDTSWLTVTAGATGSGTGPVSVSAAANPNGTTRAGTVTIGGQTFTVNQSAAPCTFSLAPTSQSVVAGGGTGSTTVTSPTGCSWSAVSNNTSWLTVTAGATGSGTGPVSFSAVANPNGTTRAGTITIGGQTFTVNQAAAPCTFSLTPTSQSVIAGGGTGSTSVTSPTGCAWTAISNDAGWLAVTAGASGSGTGTVSFSAAANPNASTRAGTITIGGQTFTVNQAAAPCTFGLTPPAQTVLAAGGPGSTNVTAPAGCSWTSSSNAAWLTITSGGSGNGNGTLNYSVAANASSVQRVGTLTAAGQTFTVTQAGVGCTFSLTPTSQSVVAGGGTGSTAVTSPAGCSWTSVSNDSWLTVTAGATGSGNGSVNFSAAANPNGTTRAGTITIGGQTFTVNQAAAPCTVSLAPTSQSVVAGGGTGSTSVTSPTGCAWSAVSNNTSWLTVTAGASGSGNGSVSFSAAANPNGTTRAGTVTIGGQTFTVNQAAAPCTFSLAPTSQSVVAGGGTGSTTVTSATGCAWTALSNDAGWLTVTAGASGSGTGTVSFNATANPNASTRAGTITIGGQTFTVNQAAAPCTFSLAPTSQSVVAGGGTGSTAVTSPTGCSWTAVSNNTSWLTVTAGATGSGNGSVSFSAAANPNGTTRAGTISIGGQTFTVNQAAAPCTFSLAPTSQSVVAGGGTGSTSVTSPTGCSWSALSNDTSWLTVTAGATGSGNGSVSFSAAANPNGTTRAGTVTIGGQTFTVNQAAAPCTFSVAPTSQSVVAGGGTGSTTVTSATGCAWTAVSNDTSWLAVTAGASGSGTGTVSFSAVANPNASTRAGTITIGGQTFTVNQAAAPCTFSLAPTSQSVVASGGTGSTAVTSPTGCSWTAVSNNTSWLTVTAGAAGSGNGSVSFSAAANPNGTTRAGTITIAGQTFTVNQAAVTCSVSVSPASQSVVAGGGTGSTSVTSPSGCSWTAVSNNTSWLTVTGGSSGSGNGTVSYQATANPNGTARTGTVTIGSQTFTVNQAPAPCTVSLTPATLTLDAAGDAGSTNVTVPGGCSWAAVSNNTSWLTVTGGSSGNGNGTVTVSATANVIATARTGTVTIGGETLTVNQTAAPCTFSLAPTQQSQAGTGGTGTTSVAAPTGCAWTGSSNDAWLTITAGGNGNGNGNLTYSAAANSSASQRVGTLTVAGQTFTVTQAGVNCTFSISPTSQSAASGGDNGTSQVTTQTGCPWSAESNVSWITVTAGASGTGSGPVSFSVQANPSTTPRSGTLIIASETFTVNQAAASCSVSVAPASQFVPGTGGTGSTNVTAPTGCNWTALSNNIGWLSVPSGPTGTGDGVVTFSAIMNVGAARTGRLTISGQIFTVNQGASCSFAIAPTSLTVAAAGGTASTALTTGATCPWTATSGASWVTVIDASGTGSGAVSFAVAPNTGTTQRSTILSIGGRTLTVTQPASTCTFTISPTSLTVAAAGGTGSTTVTTTTGCAWTATSNAPWITVTTPSGSGTGQAGVSVAANTSTIQRSGTLTIAGRTFAVTQGGATTPTAPAAPAGLRILVVGGGS